MPGVSEMAGRKSVTGCVTVTLHICKGLQSSGDGRSARKDGWNSSCYQRMAGTGRSGKEMIFDDFTVQGGTADAQQPGGFGFVPAGAVEGVEDGQPVRFFFNLFRGGRNEPGLGFAYFPAAGVRCPPEDRGRAPTHVQWHAGVPARYRASDIEGAGGGLPGVRFLRPLSNRSPNTDRK